MDPALTAVLVPMLALAAGIEFLTTIFRISFHLRSARVQHKLNWPRIHHSYPGIAFVTAYYFLPYPWLIIVGGALIISDLFHHLVLIPSLHRMHYDVCMSHHEAAHRLLQRVSGIVLLAAGIAALVTPFTPGSFLILIGLFLICGRALTRTILLSLMSRERYRKLRVEYMFEKFRIL